MDIREIRELSDEKLLEQLEDLKESLFNLRFQKAYGQLEDPNAIPRARRDVARIKMVMSDRKTQKEGNNG